MTYYFYYYDILLSTNVLNILYDIYIHDMSAHVYVHICTYMLSPMPHGLTSMASVASVNCGVPDQ